MIFPSQVIEPSSATWHQDYTKQIVPWHYRRQGAVAIQAIDFRSSGSGTSTAWLEIVLDEGRNRHIRRLLGAYDIEVLRLVRVAIGQLQLGELAKGKARHLSAEELALLQA